MSLPENEPAKSVCLAAAIVTASRCAASPGHTAQPFQPTSGAASHLRRAWSRDPLVYCANALRDISTRHAHVPGEAVVSDALYEAAKLKHNDLVVVDPPYSAVQYSRFYHVLETVARRRCSQVNGVGRYPHIGERPQSSFSKKTQSKEAFEALFQTLARTGATVILTFPMGECSNGLSGSTAVEIVTNWYVIKRRLVEGRFSTLGGNNTKREARQARQDSRELLLLLKPK